jgi:hypothetical protein
METVKCNAEEGHPSSCDANDGEHCVECQKTIDDAMADARRSWLVASPRERNRKQYVEDMRDAGRGHLLRDEDL